MDFSTFTYRLAMISFPIGNTSPKAHVSIFYPTVMCLSILMVRALVIVEVNRFMNKVEFKKFEELGDVLYQSN